MTIESAAEYYEFHETREELEAPSDHWDPWVKCATCEEFLVKAEALKLDGLWFHPHCMTDKDRVKAIEQEETEGLLDDEDSDNCHACPKIGACDVEYKEPGCIRLKE